MPITTRMKKSARKRVYDQADEGLQGEINQVSRDIYGGEHPEITPGVAGLTDPLLNKQTGRVQALLQQRRRRNLSSVRR